jgi:hypothetical protein
VLADKPLTSFSSQSKLFLAKSALDTLTACFASYHTLRVSRVVFACIGKSEQLSESSLVGITERRVAIRLDPFGVLDP